ncbi:MAG: hypothetical protein HYZ40_19360 [Rhodospirillales bacterium]|nr:hypothetical protein [Rhodospirillales bacterium]
MKIRALAALFAIVSGAGLAHGQGAAQEWPLVIEHAPGNAATCAPGAGDSLIRVRDGAMSLVFTSFPQPIWTVKLAADGSFDAVVPSYADPKGSRITVPAGSGPRVIATLTQTAGCAYRMVPKPQ